ncbi:hypothetical protein QOT17_011717 [Balamuthia mandrillaris]
MDCLWQEAGESERKMRECMCDKQANWRTPSESRPCTLRFSHNLRPAIPIPVPGSSSSSPDPTAFHNYYPDPRAYPPPSYPYQPSAPLLEQPPCGCCLFTYRDNRGKMSLGAPFNEPSPPPLLSSAYSSYATPPLAHPAAPCVTPAPWLQSLPSSWPEEPPQEIRWNRGSSFSPATHTLYSNQVTACYSHSSFTNGPPTNRPELHARRTSEQAQHSAEEHHLHQHFKIEDRQERSEKDEDDDLQNARSTSGSPPSKKPRRSVETDSSQTSDSKTRVSKRPKKGQPKEDENRERTSFDIERQRLTELRRKKGMRVKKSFLRQGPNELDFYLDRPKKAPKKSSKTRTQAGEEEGGKHVPSFWPNGSSSPQLLQPQPPGEWQRSAATTTAFSTPSFARGPTPSLLSSCVSGAATTAAATRQPHWRT